jgi:hypothetical protein
MPSHHSQITLNFIKANAPLMTDEALAQKLTELLRRPMSRSAVSKLRQRLGIRKTGGWKSHKGLEQKKEDN